MQQRHIRQVSAYRHAASSFHGVDVYKRQALFAGKVQRLMAAGYDAEEADQKAATVVARPGTSEHELGLAVDIVDASYQQLDEGQASTPVQQWLMEHCWEYGFILRYPDGKSDLTGIIYEPWHYRYAVSYTHLDVYKRQDLHRGRQHGQQVRLFLHQLPGHLFRGAVGMEFAIRQHHHLVYGGIPVSYTHLDVYKRQPYQW